MSRDAYRQYQQRTESEQQQAADKVAEDCSVVSQVNPALRDCLRQAVKAHHKQDATNKDLKAQQDMAFWALVTACVSAFGTLISVGGLYLLFQSLRQTRRAISNDREIGEAQVRAYLMVESPNQSFIGGIQPDKTFTADLVIRNTGQSPAYDVKYIAALMAETYPLHDEQGDLLVPDEASIQRGVTVGANGHTRIDASLVRPLSADEVSSIMEGKGDLHLFAVAIVTYFDVFGRQIRKTKYCAYMSRGADGVHPVTGVRVRKYEWTLANVHNEAT